MISKAAYHVIILLLVSIGIVAQPNREVSKLVTAHEKLATFLAGKDFKSVLLLENLRPDLPITFTPSLIIDAGEVQLDPIAVPAHSTASVDLNTVLSARGFPDTRGTVVIRFDFNSYGPGVAAVEIQDDKHHLFLNSYAQGAEEYWSGTAYDAVAWAPDGDAAGERESASIWGTSRVRMKNIRERSWLRGRRSTQGRDLPSEFTSSTKRSSIPPARCERTFYY